MVVKLSPEISFCRFDDAKLIQFINIYKTFTEKVSLFLDFIVTKDTNKQQIITICQHYYLKSNILQQNTCKNEIK